MSQLTQKEIVLRVTAKIDDVEAKLAKLRGELSTQKDAFASLSAGAGNMTVANIAIADKGIQQLIQRATYLRDNMNRLNTQPNVDNTGSIKILAREYGDLSTQVQGFAQQTSRFGNVFKQMTGADNQIPIVINNTKELIKQLHALKGLSHIGIDIETTGNHLKDFQPGNKGSTRVRLMSIAGEGMQPLSIDLDKMKPADMDRLSKFLSNNAQVKVGHNLAFEKSWLQAAGINMKGPVFDTMLASNEIYSHARRRSDAENQNAGVIPQQGFSFRTASGGNGSQSLQSLVYEYMYKNLPGMTKEHFETSIMNKKYQDASNWTTPTLSPEKLMYNSEDSVKALQVMKILDNIGNKLQIMPAIKNKMGEVDLRAMQSTSDANVHNQLSIKDSPAMLQNIKEVMTRYANSFKLIDTYSTAIQSTIGSKGLTQLAGIAGGSDRIKTQYAKIPAADVQGAQRVGFLNDQVTGAVQSLVTNFAKLHGALKSGDTSALFKSVEDIYKQTSILGSLKQSTKGIPFLDDITQAIDKMHKLDPKDANAPLEYMRHLGSIAPKISSMMENIIKSTLIPPSQIALLSQQGQLPSSFSSETPSLQQRRLASTRMGDLSYNSDQFTGKLKAGLKAANAELAKDVAVNMETFLRGYETETQGATKASNLAGMRDRLKQLNIPKKLAAPLLDIISHTDNFVGTLKQSNDPNGDKAYGAYEHASSEIANRLVKLRSFMADSDPLKQLAARLHRADQYIATIKANSLDSGSDKNFNGGEALIQATRVRNNLREALTNGLLVGIGKQFSPNSVSMTELDNMYRDTVQPTIDTKFAKSLSNKRTEGVVTKKYGQSYFDVPIGMDQTLGRSDIQSAEWAKMQTELITGNTANPGKLMENYNALKTSLAAKRKTFRDMQESLNNSDSTAAKFYSSMVTKLTRDIDNMKQWQSEIAKITAAANPGQNSSGSSGGAGSKYPKGSVNDLKSQMQEISKQIEEDFRGIGVALDPKKLFRDHILPQVQSVSQLRKQYSTFKSMLTGKAPAYEIPMNDAAWKEAGISNGPLQWDKSGVTQNAIKAVREHNTRIMQIYQKLMRGGDLTPFQVKELLPIARSAGLEDLASQAKSAISTMGPNLSPGDQDATARQLTAGLKLSMENALKILEQRQDVLKLVSGSMSRAAFKTKEDNLRMTAIGRQMQAVLASHSGDLAAASQDPLFGALGDVLQATLKNTPKYDLSQVKKMSTGVGRKSLVSSGLNEQMAILNESILTAFDEGMRDTLIARRNELLTQSRVSKMQNKGMSASEIAASRTRDEINTLRRESSSDRMAVTGLGKIVGGLPTDNKDEMNILAALRGQVGSISELLNPARFADIPNLITQLKARIQADTQKIAQFDDSTRTKTLGPKGAYSYELGTLKREAERSSAAALTGITGTDAIHTAYAKWQAENTQLLASIQELELKLALLRQGFKITPNLDALAAIEQQIKAARLLQAEALQGVGRYRHAGLSPAAAQAESDRILRDIIGPAEQIKKNMRPASSGNQDALTAELKLLESQAKQSWAAIATAIPNDEAAVHAAYQQWIIDNKALGDSILGLKSKLALLQEGMRLPKPTTTNTLGDINRQIRDANNLRLQALQGTGEFASLTPSARRIESNRINEESIRPLQQLKNQLRDVREADSAAGGGSGGGGHSRGLIGWLNRVAVTAGSLTFVFMNLRGLIEGLVKPGLEYSAVMEQSAIGMAGVLASLSELNGKTMEWRSALDISHRTIAKIADVSFLSGVKSDEITKLTQSLLGSGLTAGMKIDQVIDFSVTGASALKQIGMPNQQFIQELRDMLQGGIQSSSSVLATILGVTDADVVRLRQAGGLFEFLMARMQGFRIATAASMKTFEGMMTQIRDVLTRASAKGLEQVFETMKGSAESLLHKVVNINEAAGTWAIKPEIISGFKSVGDELLKITLNLSIMYQTISSMTTVKMMFSSIDSVLTSMNANLRGVTFVLTTWLQFKILSALFSGVGSIILGIIKSMEKLSFIIQGIASLIEGMAFTSVLTSVGKITTAFAMVGEAIAALEAALAVRMVVAIGVVEAGLLRLRMLIMTGIWTGLLPAGITTVLLNVFTGVGAALTTALTGAFTLFRAAVAKDPVSIAVVVGWFISQADMDFTPEAMKRRKLEREGAQPGDTDPYDILGKKAKEAAEALDKLSHSANRPDLQEDRNDSVAAKEYASHSANKPDMQEDRAKAERAADTITAKYPTMKAENVKRIAAAERSYWEMVTKSSIDIVKTQLDLAKSQLQRMYENHKLTIEEYYTKNAALERQKLAQDNVLLRKQLGRYNEDIRIVQLAGSGGKKGSTGGSIDAFVRSMSTQETGSDTGNSDAVSTVGAQGRFQIMPDNWDTWSKAVLGYAAEKTPENHDAIALGMFQKMFDELGSWEAVAKNWYAGPSYKTYTDAQLNSPINDAGNFDPNGKAPSINEYANSVMSRMPAQTAVPIADAKDDVVTSKLNPQQQAVIAKAKQALLEAGIAGVNPADATSVEKALTTASKILDTKKQILQNDLKSADLADAARASITKELITLTKAKMDLDSAYEQKFRTVDASKSVVEGMEPLLDIKFDDETFNKFKNNYLETLKTLKLPVPDEFKAELGKDFATAIDGSFSAWLNESDPQLQQLIIDKMARVFKTDALKKGLDAFVKQVDTLIKQYNVTLANTSARISLSAINAMTTLQATFEAKSKLPKPSFKASVIDIFSKKAIFEVPPEIQQFVNDYIKGTDTAKTTIQVESDKVLAAILQNNAKLKASNIQELLGPEQSASLTEANLKSLQDLFNFKLSEIAALDKQRTDLVNTIKTSHQFDKMSPRDREALADTVDEGLKTKQRSLLTPIIEDIQKFGAANPALLGQIEATIAKIRELMQASEKDTSKVKRNFLGLEMSTEELRGVLGGAFTGFLNSIQEVVNGTKTIGAAFRDMAKAVVDAMIQILIQKIALKMVDLAFTAMGIPVAATGGQIGKAATGGRINKDIVEHRGPKFASGGVTGSGDDTSDNIPILVSPGEWVIRAKAARKYGPEFMKAVNEEKLSTSDVRKFANGGIIRSIGSSAASSFLPSTPRFALGGLVNNVKIDPTQVMASNPTPEVNMTMVNLSDPNQVKDFMSSSKGSKVFLNTISTHKNTIRKILA